MSLSIADSKASFTRRVNEVGLGDKLATMKTLGYETHSDLGFAFNFTPGGSDDIFQSTLVDPILGVRTDTNEPSSQKAGIEEAAFRVVHHCDAGRSKPHHENRRGHEAFKASCPRT